MLGDDLESRPVPRDPSRIVSFSSIGPAGRQSVPGLSGSDPAGVARFTLPGDYVIAYESNHALTTQPARQFEEYLFEVGLDEIAAVRRKRGDADRPVREAYSRHAKALVGVGDGTGPVRDRRVGLRLELVLDEQGSQDAPDLRSLRLFYLGRPLGGALVTADSFGGPSPHTQQARTDSQGRASLTLHPGERWRIHAVHMVRGGRDLGAEWESLWASLSFELPRSAELPRDDHAGRCDLARASVYGSRLRTRQPAGSSSPMSSSSGQDTAPLLPPSPPLSPQEVSPLTVVPARLSRKIVPLPQRPPLVVVPANSVALSSTMRPLPLAPVVLSKLWSVV